jgi:hypothetical protein
MNFFKKTAIYIILKTFFEKALFFCKSKLEYVATFVALLCFVALCDICLYRYYKNEEMHRFNDDIVLHENIIKNLLLKDIQNAYHIDNNEEHLFCSQSNQGHQYSGIKKASAGNKTIFCNTRLIKERLDTILPKYIDYKVSINQTVLVSSNYDFTKTFNQKNYDISDDLVLKIETHLDINSLHVRSINSLTQSRIYLATLASVIVYVLWVGSIFPLIYFLKKALKSNDGLIEELKRLEVIKLADTKAKAFTNKFYKYSQAIHGFPKLNSHIDSSLEELYNTSDYLPIPLLNLGSVKSPQSFKIQLCETINELKYMVDSYAALHSYDIKLTSDISVDHIMMPFDQVLFDQVMISLMANIVYFAKDKNNTRHISLIVTNETITLIHDAFTLDKEMMIEYCQRIFYETKNPYIINFGQIFTILNKIYNLKFDVYHANQENILKIHLRNNEDSNIILFKGKTKK